MFRNMHLLATLSMILTPVFSHAQTSPETPVTAIDIALEPDATMTHHAHVTMLQQFVRTADLDKLYTTVGQVEAGRLEAKGVQVLLHP
jgi:hypothetical protein